MTAKDKLSFCFICNESFSLLDRPVLLLPCDHSFCRDCLNDMVQDALSVQMVTNCRICSHMFAAHELAVINAVPKNWSESVDSEVLRLCSKQEASLQETIFELIDKEHEYLDDLVILQELFMTPLLQRTDIIKDAVWRVSFVSLVFGGLDELVSIHQELWYQFSERQKDQRIIKSITDIYLQLVDRFVVYVDYSARQLKAKQVLDQETRSNPVLKKFIEDQLKDKRCRKLDLSHFLSRPRYRIARYPLMFEAIAKACTKIDPHHHEIRLCELALAKTKAILDRMNEETGRCENKLKIENLKDRLLNKAKFEELDLSNEARQLVYDGTVKDFNIYVLDNVLLLTKGKAQQTIHHVRRWEYVEVMEDWQAQLYYPSWSTATLMTSAIGSRELFFAIVLLGKTSHVISLKVQSVNEKEQWMTVLNQRISDAAQQRLLYQPHLLAEIDGAMSSPYCCAPFHDMETRKRGVLVGTEDGIYVALQKEDGNLLSFARIISLNKVTQIAIFPPEYRCIVVLHGSNHVGTFSFDILAHTGTLPLPSKKIEKNPIPVAHAHPAAIIKIVQAFDKDLLCVVKNKANVSESSARLYECVHTPCSSADRKDRLKEIKKYIIGFECLSIQLVNRRLLAATSNGYLLIDVASYLVTDLVTTDDGNMKALLASKPKPVTLFKLEEDFLLCYKEFGVFIRSNGTKSRNHVIYWSGDVISFAVKEPHVFAFSERFVEVHHITTGELLQVIKHPKELYQKPEHYHTTTSQPQSRYLHHLNFHAHSSPRLFMSIPGVGKSVLLHEIREVDR